MRTSSISLPVLTADSEAIEQLPQLYQSWVAELLPVGIPRERRATCDHCAMVRRPGEAFDEALVEFKQDVKCCSYVPELPNFLVGSVLGDEGLALGAGRRTVMERVDGLLGVTPLGLRAPATFSMLYDAVGSSVFGRTSAFQCPHYISEAGGSCGIWRHRNAVCGTYFCKYRRGAVGYEFWEALRLLLRCLEDQISLWCVSEIIDDGRVIEAVFERKRETQAQRLAEEMLGQRDAKLDDALWGSWSGRKGEFFIACSSRVAALTGQEALKLGGGEAQARLKLVLSSLRQLVASELPDRLEVTTDVIPDGSAGMPIVTHSTADPLFISADVYRNLARFDGRLTEDVIAELGNDGGEIDSALLRRLVDYNVLRAVEKPS